jgi:hypothetical protein
MSTSAARLSWTWANVHEGSVSHQFSPLYPRLLPPSSAHTRYSHQEDFHSLHPSLELLHDKHHGFLTHNHPQQHARTHSSCPIHRHAASEDVRLDVAARCRARSSSSTNEGDDDDLPSGFELTESLISRISPVLPSLQPPLESVSKHIVVGLSSIYPPKRHVSCLTDAFGRRSTPT